MLSGKYDNPNEKKVGYSPMTRKEMIKVRLPYDYYLKNERNEIMVKRKRKPRKIPKWLREEISKNIGEEIRAGRPRSQAVAISFRKARRDHPKFEEVLQR